MRKLTPSELSQFALFGLASQCGKIQEIFKNHYQGCTVDFSKLRNEIEQLVFYASELAGAYQLDFDEIIQDSKKR